MNKYELAACCQCKNRRRRKSSGNRKKVKAIVERFRWTDPLTLMNGREEISLRDSEDERSILLFIHFESDAETQAKSSRESLLWTMLSDFKRVRQDV